MGIATPGEGADPQGGRLRPRPFPAEPLVAWRKGAAYPVQKKMPPPEAEEGKVEQEGPQEVVIDACSRAVAPAMLGPPSRVRGPRGDSAQLPTATGPPVGFRRGV